MREINDAGDMLLVGYGWIFGFFVLGWALYWLATTGNESVVQKYERDGNLEGLKNIVESSKAPLNAMILFIIGALILLFLFGGAAVSVGDVVIDIQQPVVVQSDIQLVPLIH